MRSAAPPLRVPLGRPVQPRPRTPRPRANSTTRPRPRRRYKVAHFCSMCGPKFCSAKISCRKSATRRLGKTPWPTASPRWPRSSRKPAARSTRRRRPELSTPVGEGDLEGWRGSDDESYLRGVSLDNGRVSTSPVRRSAFHACGSVAGAPAGLRSERYRRVLLAAGPTLIVTVSLRQKWPRAIGPANSTSMRAEAWVLSRLARRLGRSADPHFERSACSVIRPDRAAPRPAGRPGARAVRRGDRRGRPGVRPPPRLPGLRRRLRHGPFHRPADRPLPRAP